MWWDEEILMADLEDSEVVELRRHGAMQRGPLLIRQEGGTGFARKT
jgi:hypothetical protein